MQIDSGWAKGLKIETPAGLATRPTRSRVRAAVLNMLQPDMAGARVLDLFAGSGAFGIEMVSRGAVGAVFVEKNPPALLCLKNNVAGLRKRAASQNLKVEPLEVLARDVSLALPQIPANSFEIIWADPPYEVVHEWLKVSLSNILRILPEDGIFVLESALIAQNLDNVAGTIPALVMRKRRDYGETLITVWSKNS